MQFKSTEAYLKGFEAALRAKDNKAVILACAHLLGQGDLTHEQHLHALRSRARARFEVGHMDGSIDDYSRAIELKPSDLELWNGRGSAHYKRNNPDLAQADFRHVAGILPNADTFIWLGVIETRLDDFAGARLDFEKALELNPANVTAFKWHAYACNKLGDHQAALDDLSRALAPDNDDLHRRKGYAFIHLDRYAEAVFEFSEVLRLKPDDADMLKASRASSSPAQRSPQAVHMGAEISSRSPAAAA